MKRRPGIVSLVFLFASACSSDLPHDAPFDSASPLEKQAKAEIVGSVTLAGESDFSQVSLKLQNDARTYTFDTEKDGALRLTGVVPGRYHLRATARYFESVTADVTVALGERYDLGNLLLNPRKAGVTGKATAETLNGKTVVTSGGVVVTLLRTGSIRSGAASAPAFRAAAAELTSSFTTISSSDGTYTFTDVPAGVYKLEASQGALAPVTAGTVKVTGEDGDVTVEPLVLASVSGFIDAVGTVPGGTSALFSQSAAVTLKIVGVHAAQMRLGQAPGTGTSSCVPGPAQAFATTAVVTLAQEGPNVLCATFIADDGSESAPAYTSMIYDQTPPALASLSVNGGAAYTRTTPLTLTLNSIDATSGVEKMVVATNAAFAGGTPQDYVPVLAYPVSSDGPKTLYVKFIDKAGNERAAAPAAITVDTLDPVLTSFTVQDAAGSPVAASVAGTRVYLALGATELNPGLQMMVATASDFSGATWQPFQTLSAYDLTPSTLAGGADRTLYVRLRDAAGNVSLTGSKTVHVDTVAPASPLVWFNAAAVSSATLTVNLSASNADWVELSPDISFASPRRFAYQAVTTYTFTGNDGERTLFARFLDNAGNASTVAAATVTLDRAGPQFSTVAINNGNPFVTGAVPIAFQVANAGAGDAVQIADNAAFTSPAAYAADPGGNSVTYSLAGPDGAKTVYVRAVDALGNVGGVFSAAVTRDTAAPTLTGPNAVQLAGGASYTTSRFVSAAFAVAGASQMLLAEDSGFTGAAWESFASETLWVLSAGDAPKTLYAKFRDNAGNVIGAYADGITLDTQAPTNPSLVLNAGAAYATTTAATVALSAVGATKMQLSNDGIFDLEPVQSYAFGNSAWSLAPGDGVKAVYVRYLDDAGNSSAVASAFTLLDTKAPVISAGSLVIDGGALTTNDSAGAVVLTLSAAEAVDVYLSEGACGTGGAWSAYAPSHAFTTSLTEGTKAVYAKFRDLAGNVSACAYDSIVRDTQVVAPALQAAVTGWEAVPGRTANQQVTLSLTGLTADVTEMMVANDASYAGAGWVPVAASTAWFLTPGDGLKTVYVKVRDAARNVKTALTGLNATPSITLDQTPPVTPALSTDDVNNDGTALSSSSVELRWTVPAGVTAFELQRRLLGLESDFRTVATPSALTSTYVDTVTSPGYTHSYRIRATDDLGNQSDWSLTADATPFVPVQAASWIRNGASTHYEFPPNAGTFLLSASYQFEDAQGLASTDVFPTNVVAWNRPIPTSDIFAEQLRVRTQNQDSSLVYESLFGIGYNERGALTVSPPSNTIIASMSLVIDSKGSEHLLYQADDYGIYITTRSGNAWAPGTKLAGAASFGYIDLVKDAADHLFAAFTLSSPTGLYVARNDGIALTDSFESPFGSSNWSLVSAGAERNALALAPPSGFAAANLDGGGDVLTSTALPAGPTLRYSYWYERQGLGDAPEGSDALYFETYDGSGWTTQRTHTPSDGSATAFTKVTGTLPAGTQKVRFRSAGGGEGTDDWFVDDVLVQADDGTWVTARVDSSVGCTDAHLAVDAQGGLHASYYANGIIRYAGWVTNAWELQDLGPTNLANSHDIAVNSAGEPSIIFWKSPPYVGMHAYRTGGVWYSEQLSYVGIWPTIAFDGADILHVLSRDGVALGYGYGTPGAWSAFTQLETDANVSDLEIDGNGKLHAAFGRSSGALWIGSDETGPWVAHEVGGADTTYRMSLKRNPLGRDEVAYFDVNSKTLRLTSYAAADWQPWKDEVVDTAGDSGSYPSVTYSTDKVGIGYVNNTSASIHFAEKTGSGWSTTTIEDAADGLGECLGAGYTQDGKAHLVYDDYSAHQIKYATNESGSWATTVLDTGAYQNCAFGVDRLNRLHAVYFKEPEGIMHRVRSGGTWLAPETVVATGFNNTDMVMALDKNSNVHVFFTGSSGRSYVNNIGGAWGTVQTFGPLYCTGCRYALAIDDQLKAHAFDVVSSGFRHATNATGAWVSELVDNDGGSVSGLSAVIGGDGHLHVFYGRQHALRYSTNLSGRWVSSDMVREGYGVGANTAVVLDLQGRFNLAYRYDPVYFPSDGDLRFSMGYFSGVLPLLGVSQTNPF